MTQTFIYVSCAESREILVFSLDADSGEVSLKQRVATPGKAQPMMVRPDRRVLYVGTSDENAVLAFAIASDSGELTLLGSAPAPANPTYVACDPRMQVLLCAGYHDDNLGVFPLNAQGVPQAVRQVETGLSHAHAVNVDGGNRWVLVPTLGADAIRVFRLEDDLRLVPSEPPFVRTRPGSGPRHQVITADSRFVYCLNELDGSIDQYDFDAATGRLAPNHSISILPDGFGGAPWAAELRATPDGRFLYATERTDSVVVAFAVDPQSGRLTLVGRYPTEKQPRGMGIDPSGRWLVAAGQVSGHMTVHAIDPASGRLTAAQRHRTGLDPICVEITTGH